MFAVDFSNAVFTAARAEEELFSDSYIIKGQTARETNLVHFDFTAYATNQE